MLVADDHQASAMGCSGHPEVRTPYLDSLAASGAIFRHAYHMGGMDDAVCIPSRASLLTGLTFDKAMLGERGVIHSACVTLPEHFKLSGYHSYAIGKWHNDKPSLARSFCDGASLFLGGMFDHYATPVHSFDPEGIFPEEQVKVTDKFSQDVFCDEACAFLESYERDEPFFLYTAFTAPHDPRTPPIEFAERYPPDAMSLPPNFLAEHAFDLGVADIRDESLGPYPRTEVSMREDLAAYYGMISSLDAGVGRILRALESTGELENTIILYTGDHGLAMGQHGLLGKQNMYEHSMRVPFILSGPGVDAGLKNDDPIYSRDAYATLCGLCELPKPEGLDSQHVLTQGRAQITGLYMDNMRMIRQGHWKLIATVVNGDSRKQLFNLQQDPWELCDLSTEFPERCEQLLKALECSDVGLPFGFDISR